MLQLKRARIQLTPTEHAELVAVVERQAPEFVDRLTSPLEIDLIVQPWYGRHRILDVQSALPFPARRIHVAAGTNHMWVLTARLESLQAIAAADPPFKLDDEENASAYAAYGNAWTRISALGVSGGLPPRSARSEPWT